jgi:uncharacterized membrane protein
MVSQSNQHNNQLCANRRAICAVTLAAGYICTNQPVISSLFSANAGQISQNLPSN